MKISELLEQLDGKGIIIIDDELIHKALHSLGYAPFDEIYTPEDMSRVIDQNREVFK